MLQVNNVNPSLQPLLQAVDTRLNLHYMLIMVGWEYGVEKNR